jgi:hypothetical protein
MFAILYSIDIHLLKKKPESAWGRGTVHPSTIVRTPMTMRINEKLDFN